MPANFASSTAEQQVFLLPQDISSGPLLPFYPTLPESVDLAPLGVQLLEWFKSHKRPLPWRVNYTPYEVWISEIMLQQTQMERGTAYFTRWMEQFPTVQDVAKASLDEIHKAWEGLGYYSRAKNLHKSAQILAQDYQGEFPKDPNVLKTLPGIGPYTAGAICSIAFNLPAPIVDANVTRVFSRVLDIDAPTDTRQTQEYLWQTAARAIPQGQARDFNQALMELGALVCVKKPRCSVCPIAEFCHAARLNVAHERPLPRKKTIYSHLPIISGLLIHNGHIFIQKRLDQGVWAGLWEFPGGKLEADETPEQGIVREFAEETEFSLQVSTSLGALQHAYTRYRITLHGFICALRPEVPCRLDANGFPIPTLHAATTYRWIPPALLQDFAFPAGHRKLIDLWRDQILAATGVPLS